MFKVGDIAVVIEDFGNGSDEIRKGEKYPVIATRTLDYGLQIEQIEIHACGGRFWYSASYFAKCASRPQLTVSDDSEPITEEWLTGIGFVKTGSAYSASKLTVAETVMVANCPTTGMVPKTKQEAWIAAVSCGWGGLPSKSYCPSCVESRNEHRGTKGTVSR